MTITSNEYFRYSKPIARDIKIRVPLYPNAPVMRWTDQVFENQVKVPMQGNYHIVKGGLQLSNPEYLDTYRDYTVDNNLILTMKEPGRYILRTFSQDMSMWLYANNVPVLNWGTSIAKFSLGLGVPCVPELLSGADKGFAAISQDKLTITYHPHYLGDDGFTYRLVNRYGQVSEPACVFVRAYTPNPDGSDPSPDEMPQPPYVIFD